MHHFGQVVKLFYILSLPFRVGEYNDLWELRTKFSSNNIRVIYFLHIKNTFILLHGFKKKANKIPKRKREMAKREMIEYIILALKYIPFNIIIAI